MKNMKGMKREFSESPKLRFLRCLGLHVLHALHGENKRGTLIQALHPPPPGV